MQRELERYRAIYKNSHDAVLIFDPTDNRLVDCNPRTREWLGIPANDAEAIRLTDLHDEDEAFLRSLTDDVMDDAHGRSFRINYRAADGHLIPAEVSASRILLDTGNLLLFIARDVSERENAAQQIQHLAYHDTLTNLPNRARASARLTRSVSSARFGRLVSVSW